MGFVVLWNYINVMTLFPAALLVNEYALDRFCAKDQDKEQTENSAAAAASAAVAPENAVAPANAVVKKGRKRLKRHSTLSLKETGGKVNVVELTKVERCFYGCFTNVIWKGRFVWVGIGFAMAIVGTWAGFTYFKPLKGQPQIFLKERNQGGLDDYKYNRFAVMDQDVIHLDLANAIKANTEYQSAADATAAANEAAGTLISDMSCDILQNKVPSPGQGWTNLGTTFTVDDTGNVEKLFTITNKGKIESIVHLTYTNH